MWVELFIALLLGILFGCFTGLSPGIHINLVAAFLVSLSAFFLKITHPITLVTFIVAMGITHTFTDFIPSIFLGSPEESTALSVLPGHQLLMEGKGYEAVKLSAYGSLLSIVPIIILLPIFLFLLPKIQTIITMIIPYLLILTAGFIIIKEKNKFLAILILLLSGFLGIAILNSTINQPFLPMFTGLFGISSLIVSIKSKAKIPPQITRIKTNKKELIYPMIAASIISPLCSFIPALGSGQAATISSTLIDSTNKKFLVILGATNTMTLGLGFIVLYSIQKSRTGLAVMVDKLLPTISASDLLLILLIIIITGLIAFSITLFIGKIFSKIISKINYKKLSIWVIIFLIIFTILISSFQGLLALIFSTILGLLCILSETKRINLMGCLLIPTILIYLI